MGPARLLRFGAFELDIAAGELRRQGVKLALQDLPLRLLIELALRPGEIVTREELQEALWGEDVFVDFDASLNTAVRRAREALDDSAVSPRFIETVPRRGYRFLSAVETTDAMEDRTPLWREPTLWVLAIVIAAAGGGWLVGRQGVGSRGLEPRGPNESQVRAELARARHFSERRTREGLEKSIAAFQSALASDPEVAEAYAGIARSYLLLGVYDFWRPLEAFTPARRMADRALELDPGSPDAHLVAGMLAAFADWNWREAEAGIDEALELDPQLTEAHYARGVLFSFLGRHDEGLAATRRALELDSVSPVINTMLAWQYFFARRPEDALAQTRRTLELAPDYFDAWDNLKWMHLTWGNESEAIAAWRRADLLEHGKETELSAALVEHGLRPVAEEVARWSVRESGDGAGDYRSPYDVVLSLALVGEVDTAIDWLERSFSEHETDLLAIGVDPRLDALRGNRRFEEMVERLGLASE